MRMFTFAVFVAKQNYFLNNIFIRTKQSSLVNLQKKYCSSSCSSSSTEVPLHIVSIPVNLLTFDSTTNINLLKAYNSASSYLGKWGVPEADISARMILCDITKIGYRISDFNNNLNIQLSSNQLNQLSEYCKLRSERQPLQYVIGR